jgi:serine/threonine-protein kinase
MVTTDFGTCEWFVWDVRRSNLIERGELDRIVAEFVKANPQAEPPALAEFLVAQNLLTEFQAERLLQGKTQGFVLGPYSLLGSLGSGSMGAVYKAVNKHDNRNYVIKVLPRRSMWNVRVAKRKVKVFEECRHPSIVSFVDVGTSGGTHYLVWEYVEGETLDKLVERQGRLPPEVAATYLLQAAEGLEVCHRQGQFHGLLKPSNFLIGADQKVHTLDIGIGSLLTETEGESLVDTMSTANAIASGLDCSSPESIMQPTNLTAAGDQYSLGCVLYYCLTGRFPFADCSAAEKMVAHQVKQPIPVGELAPETPEELIAVVERLMQKAPTARYGSTADVVAALRSFAIPLESVALRTRSDKATKPAAASRSDAQVEATKRQLASPYMETPPPSTRPTRNFTPRPASSPSPPPTRQAVRSTYASVSARAEREPTDTEDSAQAELEAPAVPQSPDYTTGYQEPQSFEDRLGPTGVTICAIILCAVVWLMAWRFF